VNLAPIVVPFPRTRDRRFIARHALRMSSLPQKTAEKHLAHYCNQQAEVMARRGIGPDVIAEHRQALETAIRCELWRLVIYGQGGAA
jgi:hypothetical protein